MTQSRILTLDTRSARRVASAIPLPILLLQCGRALRMQMTSRGGRAKHGRPRSLGVKANDYLRGYHRERGEQLAHPGIDVVTDVAHVGKRQINRILNVPVEVAATGVDRRRCRRIPLSPPRRQHAPPHP